MNFKALTSLRFFAALYVILYHYKDSLTLINISSYTSFFSRTVLVEFFFIMSGFIVTHVYFNSIKNHDFKLIDFLVKRLARMYPLHFVTLIFFVFLGIIYSIFNIVPVNPERYNFGAILPNLFLIHAWGIENRLTFNFPSWAVSAEWFAYLLFYPIILVILKFKERILICVLISVSLLLILWNISNPIFHENLTRLSCNFAIVRIIPEFIIGITLYLLFQKYRISKNFIKPILILSVLLLVISYYYNLHDFFAIISYCILIFTAAEITRNNLNSILNNRVLVYLGEISYAIYMVHAAVQTVYFHGFKYILNDYYFKFEIYIWIFSFPLVILCAVIAYKLIEKPSRKYIQQFFHKYLVKFNN